MKRWKSEGCPLPCSDVASFGTEEAGCLSTIKQRTLQAALGLRWQAAVRMFPKLSEVEKEYTAPPAQPIRQDELENMRIVRWRIDQNGRPVACLAPEAPTTYNDADSPAIAGG